ncbi:hypothetical protein, partial [Streptomyces scabiei]|uniref:hypothetical protein n=1 Tax=Streptomyces scabiei TaxID=1930 RepID=UPI001F15EB41
MSRRPVPLPEGHARFDVCPARSRQRSPHLTDVRCGDPSVTVAEATAEALVGGEAGGFGQSSWRPGP